MKELTKSELQIMQYLWELERGFVKDIVELFPDPKPAYNTVSTIIRILVKKGFVGYTAYGKTHEYYPLIDKESYTGVYFKNMLSNFFAGSKQQFASYFTSESDLTLTELKRLKALVEAEIKRQKSGENET